ncbi:MAG: hypothetical protein ACOCUT_00425 [bacterium]
MRDGSILKVEFEDNELIGIVPLQLSSIHNQNYLENFNWGFPAQYQGIPTHSYEDSESIKKISELNKSQFIEHLEKQSEKLYSLTETKDLVAACFASRYHFLNGIIENIKKDDHEGIFLHNIMPEYPETGVYVLSARDQTYGESESGWRNSQDPSKINLEGIIFNPRVTPRMASQIVSRWYGNKFGSVEGVEINSGINFNSFFCHEVPDFAVDFVKNPATFTSPAKRKNYPAVDYYEKK